MTPLEWLESEGWTVEFDWIDKNTLGMCHFDTQRIRISIKALVVQCFLHEYYHARENTSSERVEQMAWRKLSRMTLKEIDELYTGIVEVSCKK